MDRYLDLLRYYEKLVRDSSFHKFNKEMAIELWGAFNTSLSLGHREEKMVKEFVNITNGKTFNGISLHSKFIHGTESRVKFFSPYEDNSRELGDALVISVIKRGPEILLSKVCFIQHKKAAKGGKKNSWDIQKDQLFLLKNFPPFSGVCGIFSGKTDVIFRNDSGCLGAYGLLGNNGNMTFASAPIITDLLKGNNRINDEDISWIDTINIRSGQLSYYPLISGRFSKELVFLFHEHGWHGGYLRNTTFCRDLFDFTNNWMLGNIGEVSFAFGESHSSELHSFTRWALKQLGLSEIMNIDSNLDNEGHSEWHEGGLAISAMVTDVHTG